jgi:alcohol dehydrogenase
MFTYYIPTKILFGAGSLKQLGKAKLPGKKALIVISAGPAMKKYGYLETVQALLTQNGVTSVVFDKILPNPIKQHVMEGAEMARENGCDFILGLGGGSSIDAAKSIAIMVKNPGDYWDYIFGGTGKGQPITEPILPVVAITTTAGTGTEADPWTVISHEDRQEKIGFGNDQTFPVLSIVDPEMMLSIPPGLTAYQGFDAFFHAAEGYIANIATPISDAYALKSIELLAEYLPTAVQKGDDLEARTQVALANTLSGMVESTSACTSEHSFEHAMSARHPELPHGAGLIMLSNAYFEFFNTICPERMDAMAKAMNAPDFLTGLKNLQEACGVANLKMSEYGIIEAELPDIVANARKTMTGLFNFDRHKLTDEESLAILKKAFA